jgi:hypothetical protein
MAIVVASAYLNDNEFLAQFNNCRLPLSSFRHGDHLRLGWICLHRYPFPEALALVRAGILRFAAHHDVSHIFHETVTTAWMRLLSTHTEESFEEFLRENEHRLTLDLLHRFWTPATLNSEGARTGWVSPDRSPLPSRS